MDNKHKNSSIVGPSFLIGIGIVLLLDNLGYLQWDFWQIIQLWPVLLIVGGLELLLQGRLYGRILIAGVVLALIVGGVWMMANGQDSRSKTEIEYLRNDASSFVLNLKPSMGKISIDAYNDSANLIGGHVIVPRSVKISEDFTAGDRARLRLAAQNSTQNWWPGKNESWNLKLNRDALLDMELDLAIGEMDLNLSNLNVNRMNTDFGIASVTIYLPASGNYDILIDGGIGTIILEIPYETAVIITTDTGIVSKTMPSDYTRVENDWISPQYAESENRANISMSLGIGSIVVKRIPQP